MEVCLFEPEEAFRKTLPVKPSWQCPCQKLLVCHYFGQMSDLLFLFIGFSLQSMCIHGCASPFQSCPAAQSHCSLHCSPGSRRSGQEFPIMGNRFGSMTLTPAPVRLEECLSHPGRLPRHLTRFAPLGGDFLALKASQPAGLHTSNIQ